MSGKKQKSGRYSLAIDRKKVDISIDDIITIIDDVLDDDDPERDAEGRPVVWTEFKDGLTITHF